MKRILADNIFLLLVIQYDVWRGIGSLDIQHTVIVNITLSKTINNIIIFSFPLGNIRKDIRFYLIVNYLALSLIHRANQL